MNRHYYALVALVASALLSPAAIAQPAHHSRAGEVVAEYQAHISRLSIVFPGTSYAPSKKADVTYVINERTLYALGFDGILTATSQSRFSYEDTRQEDGLWRKIETSYDWDGSAFSPESRTTYVHMWSPPLHLRTEFEEWNPSLNNGAGGFELTSELINVFGGNQGSSLPTRVTYQTRDGDEYEFVERTWYTVGGSGLNAYYTEGETEIWTGSEWVATERFLVEQDGADVIYTDQVMDDGTWVTTERTRYLNLTILELNSRFRQLMEEIEDTPGLFVAMRLPDFVAEEFEDGALVASERQITQNEYEGGLLVRSTVTQESLEGEDWFPYSRFVTHYIDGPNGTPVALYANWEMYDGDDWEFVLEESYEYHAESGRLSTVTWSTLDEEEDEMVVVFRIEFDWVPSGTGTSNEPIPVAGRFALDAPYPNPTASPVNFVYRLETPSVVSLHLYDALGRRLNTLFDGQQTAGTHPMSFDAASLPNGLYFIRLEANGVQQTRALTVVR